MPVTILTLDTSLVRGTTAKFNGNLTDMNGQASIDCYFQYRITGAGSWSDTSANKEELTAAGEFSYEISGLTENESYEVRAVAEWDDGGVQNVYGDTETFNAYWVRESAIEDWQRGIISDLISELSFEYTREAETISLPPGAYLVELWGAEGGINTSSEPRPYGGYAKGVITLTEQTNVHVRVGQYPGSSTSGGWNGGGNGTHSGYGRGGGGATDIRIGGETLYDRVLVAGGGGGSNHPTRRGGGGGGLTGLNAGTGTATGGTQSAGGSPNGAFGVGGNHSASYSSGGGGGWFGGGGGNGTNFATGAGGSSYIGGTQTIDTHEFPKVAITDGHTDERVNVGHGKAKITVVGDAFLIFDRGKTSGTRQKPYKITNTISEITWTATTPTDTTLAIEAQVQGTTAITDEAVGTYLWPSGLSFTGSNSWIDLGNTLYLTDNHPFTAEGCIIFDSFSSRDMLLSRNDAVKSGSPYTWLLGTIDGTKMSAYDGGSWREINYSFVLNTVYHLAFAYDGTDMYFYVDGELVGIYEGWTFSDSETGRNTQIGGYNGSTGDVHGKKWNVRFWDYARTQQQIDDNKHVYIRESQAGLLLNVPMVEEEGDIVYDKSGNGYNGTIIGASWEANNYSSNYSLNYWPANTPVIKLDGVETTGFVLNNNDRRKIIFYLLPNPDEPDEPAITASYTAVDYPQEDDPEIQTLDLDSPSGGTFKLGDGTSWTADLAHDASAADIETALEGLYGAGNVEVADLSAEWALEFDGVDDHVDLPKSDFSITTFDDISFEAWVYWKGLKNDNESGIYVIIDNNVDTIVLIEINTTTNNKGNLRARWTDNNFSVSEVIEKEAWVHIAAVYDDVNKKSLLYVNGEKVGENDGDAGIITTSPDRAHQIGSSHDTGTRSFNGLISEARIWNKALTQQEIQDNMNKSLEGNEDGLVAYYPMNEGEGTTVYDESTNSNNGTITGASWVETQAGEDKMRITFDFSVGNSGLTADFTGLT